MLAEVDRGRAEFYRDLLTDRGLETWLRVDEAVGPRGHHLAVAYTFEVLVPETESDFAQALIDGPLAGVVSQYDNMPPTPSEPGSDLFFLRNQMDVEMPRAGRRRKDRAARRALAELDGAPVTTRIPLQPQGAGSRGFIIGASIVLALMAVGVLLMVRAGQW